MLSTCVLLAAALAVTPTSSLTSPLVSGTIKRPSIVARSRLRLMSELPEDNNIAASEPKASPPPPMDTALVAASPQPSARNPALVLAALVLLYVTNQWARMLPSFLVSFDAAGQAGRTSRELMNLALNFDATQYGFLVSYGFTLFYVACSFPAGLACDMYPRKIILLLAAAGWSGATALSAVSRNYAQLLGARLILGVSQAFSGPAAHTLVSSTFPPARRATVNAIYTSGIYLGGALASSSMILSKAFGWRAAAMIVAASVAPPAMLLAFALREPSPKAVSPSATVAKPAASPNANSGTGAGGFAAVLAPRSVRWLLCGATARLFAGFAIGAWAAPYFRSAFPSRAGEYALINALIVAGGGTLSAVSGGLLADRLSGLSGQKATPHRAALLPMLGALAAIPFWLCAVRSDVFGVAMGGLLAAYLLAECWYGATIAMLQGALPQRVWGAAQGTLNCVQVVANLSPLIIGALHTRGAPLRQLLSVAVPVSYVLTAFCFWRAMIARKAEAVRVVDT
jgi:MFS family permease